MEIILHKLGFNYEIKNDKKAGNLLALISDQFRFILIAGFEQHLLN